MSDAHSLGVGNPKHAHLWLPPAQRDAWLAGNKTSSMAAFSSVMSFWLLHVVSIRILNKKFQVKTVRGKAELQHAACALLHSMLAVAAGFYLLLYRDLGKCSGRAFCYDEQSWLLMDLHVGFLIYELLFYHNHAKVLRPQYGMVLLHHVLLILGYLMTKMYPCKLSLELLPLYQLANVAGIFDALRMLLNQLGARADLHFNNLIAMMVTSVVRCAAAAVAAWKAIDWIKSQGLWSLELPEDQSLFSIPYGVLLISGSCILLLIYIKWFVEGTEMVNNLIAAVERQQARAAAAKGQQQQQGGKAAKGGRERKVQ